MRDTVMNGICNGSLRKMLADFGVLDQFDAGQGSCGVCGNAVNWPNLMGVFLQDRGVKFLCDDYHCYDVFQAKSRTRELTSSGYRH